MERSPDAYEAAAIASAIARFEADTAPAAETAAERHSPWQRAALAEGVGAKRSVLQHREGGVKWLS